MHCSTCGESLEAGVARCPTCGTVIAPTVISLPGVRRCLRCGYQGQGISYFSRPGHVGLLVGVSLFTYGIGGLVYWLARRRHRVCPNCGLGWEQATQPLPGATADGKTFALPSSDAPDPILPSGGVKRRVFGIGLILFATLMILMGIVEFEMVSIVVGSVMGAGGTGMFYWGRQALEARRQAVLTGLQRRVLRLATKKGGTLTVTEVAADLNLSIPSAEKVLLQMEDGFRVRSDITREGILLFEFPEVMHRPRLEPGSSSSSTA